MRRIVLCLVLPVLLVCAPRTYGDVIAYEPFLYAPATPLDGLNGGTGFTVPWFQDAYDYEVVSGSLRDPTDTLATSGNSLRHTGLQPRARRDVDTILGTTGTTVYVAFVLRQDAIGDFVHDDHDFGGLILGGTNTSDAFGTNGLYIGRGGPGEARDEWVLGKASTPQEVSSGIPVVLGSATLLAVHIDFLHGPDKATLYVDPVPGSQEPAHGTVKNDLDLGTFTQIAVTNGNNSVWTLDEIRVAASWEAVTAPVPEPSTFLSLIVVCALGSICYSRRSRRKPTRRAHRICGHRR